MAINTAIEIPSYLFCLFTLDKLGRRPTLIGTQLISGLACLATIIIPSDSGWKHWIIVLLSTIGKFATSAAFAVVFLQVNPKSSYLYKLFQSKQHQKKNYNYNYNTILNFRSVRCFQHQLGALHWAVALYFLELVVY